MPRRAHATEQNMVTRKTKRRWFQFSLRTLLIGVFVLSLPLSWFAVRMERARRQREAVEAIERLGGWVVYTEGSVPEDPAPEDPFDEDPFDSTPDPDWGRRLLGVDFWGTVVEVHFFGYVGYLENPASDADLAHLTRLPKLEVLFLANVQVTDAGLVHIGHLSRLRHLHLCSPDVSDAGLVHLENLINLETLVLDCIEVTDEGLAHLEGLSNLEWLFVYNTQVTPEGVKKLQEALPECDIYYWGR